MFRHNWACYSRSESGMLSGAASRLSRLGLLHLSAQFRLPDGQTHVNDGFRSETVSSYAWLNITPLPSFQEYHYFISSSSLIASLPGIHELYCGEMIIIWNLLEISLINYYFTLSCNFYKTSVYKQNTSSFSISWFSRMTYWMFPIDNAKAWAARQKK